MSPAVKNGLLLVVVIVIIAVSVHLFRRGGGESALPRDAGFTEWMCDTCGERINLSAAELNEWLFDAKKREMGREDQACVFWCRRCQKFSVVGADIDPTTGEWYITYDSKGQHHDPPPTALLPLPEEAEALQQ